MPWRVAVPWWLGGGWGGTRGWGRQWGCPGLARRAPYPGGMGGGCCCGAEQRCGFIGIKALLGAESIPPTAASLCAASQSSKHLWKQHLGRSLLPAPSQAPPRCCSHPAQPPPSRTSAQRESPHLPLGANLGVLGGLGLLLSFVPSDVAQGGETSVTWPGPCRWPRGSWRASLRPRWRSLLLPRAPMLL